jgi:hypothetical protein
MKNVAKSSTSVRTYRPFRVDHQGQPARNDACGEMVVVSICGEAGGCQDHRHDLLERRRNLRITEDDLDAGVKHPELSDEFANYRASRNHPGWALK